MQFDHRFLKLPISFCPATLAEEVRALPASAWQPHPGGFVGNEAVPLVTPGGAVSDAFKGPMAATAVLRRLPYIMEIMAELGAVWGRSRLMGLAPGAEVPPHVDSHYYWRTHHRLHIPVITNPDVSFTCDGETVHMEAGECWMFDSFRFHEVHNNGTEQRVHLVLDTVGGERLFELMDAAKDGATEAPMLRPGERRGAELAFEQVNAPKVMSPWEIRCHIALVAEHAEPSPLLDKVMRRMERFVDAWGAAFAEFGTDDAGIPTYQRLLLTTRHDLNGLGGAELALRNEVPVYRVFDELIFAMAVAGPRVTTLEAGVAGNRRLAS